VAFYVVTERQACTSPGSLHSDQPYIRPSRRRIIDLCTVSIPEKSGQCNTPKRPSTIHRWFFLLIMEALLILPEFGCYNEQLCCNMWTLFEAYGREV